MNRFDRITALLLQLQSKKIVRAQELADRFGISLRTVYRDIRSLEEAGVPLYGEAGTGYSLVEGYRLPPVMFTPEEAMAFITAGKLMEKFSDNALKSHFETALFKVKAVLRTTEKDLLEHLDQHIIVDEKPGDTDTAPANTLDVLLKAIADKRAVALTYRAFGADGDTTRVVEPIGIFHEHESWYTIGYCHLRADYRQFKISRIVAIKTTEQPQKEHASLKEFKLLKEKTKALLPLQKAVIRVDYSAVIYIQDRRHYYGFVSEEIKEDYVEMTFLSQSLDEGLARWFLMFADYAEIVEPQQLKDSVAALLQNIKVRNPGLQGSGL